MSGAAESALLLVWLCLLAAWDIRLAAGGLLLAAARISREAVGYGDGICFCLLAFWLPWEELYTLLFTALVLCALPGLAAGLIRGRRLKALPFLPFVAGAYLVLLLLALSGGA